MSNRSRRGNSTHSPNGSNSHPKSKRNSSGAKRHSPPAKSGRTRGSKKNSPPKSGKRRSDFERKKEQLKRRRGGGGHNGHGGNRSKSVPPKIKKEKKKRRSKLAKFFSKMCGTGPIALDFSLNDDALRHVERAGLIPDEVRKLRHCFSMIDYDESGDVGKNFHCFFEYRCTTK